MKKYLTYICIIFVFCAFASGCANVSPYSAIRDAGKKSKATVLFKLKITQVFAFDENKVSPLNTLTFHLMNSNSNIKKYYLFSRGQYASSFVSISLDDDSPSFMFISTIKPGKYKLLAVSGFSVAGTFRVPVLLDFEVKGGELTYLGAIEGTIRQKRKDDQVIVGGSIIDQIARSDISMRNAAFDVVIKDDYEYDMQIYRAKYPKLENYEIKKAILPAWTRPLAKDVPRTFRNKDYVGPEDLTPMTQESN